MRSAPKHAGNNRVIGRRSAAASSGRSPPRTPRDGDGGARRARLPESARRPARLPTYGPAWERLPAGPCAAYGRQAARTRNLWAPRRNPDGPPSPYVAAGTWPDARLADDAPPSAHVAQALARRLLTLMDERELSARAAADLVGSTHPTIGRILDGSGVTDVRTIFLLEVALQAPLWPANLHRDFRLDLRDPGAST
jgi:hypothetical protein